MSGAALLAAVEVATLAVLALLAVRALRRRARAGRAPTVITGSFEDTLAAIVPRRAARLLLLEVHGWSALGRLVARRGRRPAPAEFAYASDLALLMGILLGLTLVETPVLIFLGAVLLPWFWVQVALVVVELYAIWFVASTWAGMVTSPHAIRDGALHLRVGLLAGIVIPIAGIESASAVRRHWSGFLGPLVQEGVAALPVAGSTEIALRLRRPAVLWRVIGRDVAVVEVHVHADDPRRMLEALGPLLVSGEAPQPSAAP